jgi:hypothetical protein
MKGIYSFISRLGVESDRFQLLDQIDSECETPISALIVDWKQEESILGNKENKRSNPRPSPQAKMPLYESDTKEPFDRGTLPTTENGLQHRVPTPLGTARGTTYGNPTPRGTVLTPRSANFGFTTPRAAIPTYGPTRTSSTITPISEDKVIQESNFPERGPDSLLPMRTFSFEEAVKNERNRPNHNSGRQNSPGAKTLLNEPKPVESPRGDAGPLYLVPSTDEDTGSSVHEPEPVLSPKGKSGPIYLQKNEDPISENESEDPYEWAYEIWRSRGLMPAKAKPLCLTSASQPIPSNASKEMKNVASRSIVPSYSGSTFNNRERTILEATPTSQRSRRSRFTNVLHHWEERSKDKPNSPFLAAQYEPSPPPELPEPPPPSVPDPQENTIIASSASLVPMGIRPSPQAQLSLYVSKYSPPRPSSMASRRTMRCSLDKSEAIYNDGSEPFARQASQRSLNKRIRAPPSLQHDVETVVTGQDNRVLKLTWAGDEQLEREPIDEPRDLGRSHRDQPLLKDSSCVSNQRRCDDEGANPDFIGDRPLIPWQSPHKSSSHGLTVDRGEEERNKTRLARRDDRVSITKSEALVPYEPSQADVVNHDDGCLCGKAFIEGNDDLVDFFLPRLDIGCTCGQNHDEFDNPDEPTALENILRPWQCEFLRSFGIFQGDQLVKAFHRSAGFLSKGLKQWRIHHQGLPSVRTRSCVMALGIWSRSCKAYVRSIRFQLSASRMPLQRPNILGPLSLFLQQMDVEAIFQAEETPQLERHIQQRRKSSSRRSLLRKAVSRPAIEAESQVEF